MFKYPALIISLLLNNLVSSSQIKNWEYRDKVFLFSWDLQSDNAELHRQDDNTAIWRGSLLPSFKLTGKIDYLKPTVDFATSIILKDSLRLSLIFGEFATGTLKAKVKPWGIDIIQITVNWTDTIPEIIDMYVGTSGKTPEQVQAHFSEENAFYADWSAAGYCIPGAKEGPAQSYFRSWDFGQSNIPLGSFGPSMGAPYAAAYPRPVLFASMGNDKGWITVGAGSLPDAAMTLLLRNNHSCFQFHYREDIWGAPATSNRTWNNFLRLGFNTNAWTSMRQYVESFPNEKQLNNAHQKAIWNTWGNWKSNEYAIAPIVDFALKTKAEIIVLDDPWEALQNSSLPNLQKFPTFFKDIDLIHTNTMEHGIWKSLVWVDEPYKAGLTNDDLLVGKDGLPCKSNWNFDPLEPGHFELDISSTRAKSFLIEKTKAIMNTIHPKLIKLDFGYGISDANVSVPRDPTIRGERYCYALAKIIGAAARSVDPDVTMLYYGISPLFQDAIDMVSLDDQGDLWYQQSAGHDQWSIWASLLSQQKIALNGSSSYDWSTDDETLLNTVVLGSPGSVLPDHYNSAPVADAMINRRFAVNSWYRRSIQWQPEWYNTDVGGMLAPMQINCWGRTEIFNGHTSLTALSLRERGKKQSNKKLPEGYHWTGRWSLIAQDNKDISASGNLAVIPFDENSSVSFPLTRKPAQVMQVSYKSSRVFNAWQWKNGMFTLNAGSYSLGNTAGFVLKAFN